MDRLMRPDPRLDRLLGGAVDPGLSKALTQGVLPPTLASFRPSSSIAAVAGLNTPNLAGFKMPSPAETPAIKGMMDGVSPFRNSPMMKCFRVMREAQEATRINRIMGLGRAGETATSVMFGRLGLTRQAAFLRKINATSEARRHSMFTDYSSTAKALHGLAGYSPAMQALQGQTGLMSARSGVFRALDAQLPAVRPFDWSPWGSRASDAWSRFSASAAAFRTLLDSPAMRAWAEEMEAEAAAEEAAARFAWLAALPSHKQLGLLLLILAGLNRGIVHVEKEFHLGDPYGVTEWTTTLVTLGMILVYYIGLRRDE